MSLTTSTAFGNVVGSTTVTTVYARSHSQSVDDPVPYDDPQAERTWTALAERFGEEQLLDLSLTDRNNVVGTILRGLQLDRVCRRFLTRHPEGQVVSLGIGLCNRRARLAEIDAPFYGVDFPEVIALRRQTIDDDVELIAGSLTQPAWLDHVPTGRPTLVMAEGVLMYLTPAQATALLVRVGDRFGGGTTFAADVFSLAAARLPHPIKGATGVSELTGCPGAEGLARRAPGWRVAGEHDLMVPIGHGPARVARLHRLLLRTPLYFLAELVHQP